MSSMKLLVLFSKTEGLFPFNIFLKVDCICYKNYDKNYDIDGGHTNLNEKSLEMTPLLFLLADLGKVAFK